MDAYLGIPQHIRLTNCSQIVDGGLGAPHCPTNSGQTVDGGIGAPQHCPTKNSQNVDSGLGALQRGRPTKSGHNVDGGIGALQRGRPTRSGQNGDGVLGAPQRSRPTKNGQNVAPVASKAVESRTAPKKDATLAVIESGLEQALSQAPVKVEPPEEEETNCTIVAVGDLEGYDDSDADSFKYEATCQSPTPLNETGGDDVMDATVNVEMAERNEDLMEDPFEPGPSNTSSPGKQPRWQYFT